MKKHATEPQTVNKQSPSPLAKFLVVGAMMSVMAGSLTGLMTYVNLGFNEAFVSNWLRAFASAVLVMMPIGIVAMAGLTKLAKKLFPSASNSQRNLAIGIVMALLMESLLALVSSLNHIGFADGQALLAAWRASFLAALPVGLVLMLVISTTIKPRVEAFLAS